LEVCPLERGKSKEKKEQMIKCRKVRTTHLSTDKSAGKHSGNLVSLLKGDQKRPGGKNERHPDSQRNH